MGHIADLSFIMDGFLAVGNVPVASLIVCPQRGEGIWRRTDFMLPLGGKKLKRTKCICDMTVGLTVSLRVFRPPRGGGARQERPQS